MSMWNPVWATLFTLTMLVGCGGGGDNLAVYPVTGTVKFNGSPMQGGGSISFVTIGDAKGKNAGGAIDESGKYTLSTYGNADGSIPGEFRVVITQVVEEEPEPTQDGQPVAQSKPAIPENQRIPEIYSDFNNSPLKATVKTEKNVIDFDLKPDAAADAQQTRPAGA